MKVFRTLVVLSLFFMFVAETAYGQTTDVRYEIRAAEVSPDTAQITEESRSANITLLVRVKAVGRFAGNVPTCEAAIDFGDGSPAERTILGKLGGTSNINEIPHTYTKPGNFLIRIIGTRSTLACAGRTSAEALVLGPNDTAASAPSASSTQGGRNDRGTQSTTSSSRQKRNSTIWDMFDTDSVTVEQGRSPCPPGWELVPKSNNAQYRFQCRQTPVKPIACQGGSTFFDNGTVIGCK